MKYNKIILSVFATLATFAACDENKMEWVDSDSRVSVSDIPLEIEEKIANYDYIKSYAATYHPEITVGGGIGADLYLSDDTYKKVADENYQLYTLGNAMKHGVVVSSTGNMDFTTIDNFLAAAPSDMKVYGHNFIWHTQQNQTYLRKLIAPELIIDQTGSSSSDVCENVVTNYGFTTGDATGYTGLWGKYTYVVEQPGADGDDDYCIHFTMTDETTQNWDSQLFWALDDALVEGTTYAFSFDAKSDQNIDIQFLGQNASYAGIYKDTYTTSSEWVTFTGEFEYDGTNADIIRVGFQFGGTPGSNVYIDNFKFGVKKEDPMDNVVTNYSFSTGDATGYTGLWGKYTYAVETPGYDGDDDYCIHFTMTDETTQNWDSQLFWTLDDALVEGIIYAFTFDAKSDQNIDVQFLGQNASYAGIYKDTYTTASEWMSFEGEFEYDGTNADIIRVGFQFGGTPGSNVYIDNFKFGVKKDQTLSSKARRKAGYTYVAKTDEEKKDALLGAMEDWISGMCSHIYDDGRFVAWDVVNEPIMDGGGWRGIDGFGGSDNDGVADSEPTETETEGLSLNWASDSGNEHFYWGYYLGKDYACKAFEFAHQYAPSNVKLFVNDYNLETSPTKLADLISFVDYIDQNNSTGADIVDGIGTQMHLTASSITEDEIDTMFKTLAATGKLIRVTELDVALGTSSPSSDQLELQAEVYQMVFDSYFENVPEAQRSGITIWGLSDNANEHEYWLNGDCPNLFDANYERKWAYKGVCDGIAGYDVSTDFTGEDWVNAYTTDDEEEEEDETSSEE